jgi:hypothetical protein
VGRDLQAGVKDELAIVFLIVIVIVMELVLSLLRLA